MLPTKINDLIKDLRTKTENGGLVWEYDDDDAKVALDRKDMKITISYRFDEIEEVGTFRVDLLDKRINKYFTFSTDQTWDDYKNVSFLYDCAQSSGLNTDFDI